MPNHFLDGDDYINSRGEMYHNMYSNYTSRVMQGNSYNQNHKFMQEKGGGYEDVSALNSINYQKYRF